MFTSLLALVVASTPAPPPVFAGSLQGNYSVVSGTLVAGGPPSTSPQSITIHFGGTDHVYNNIYLLGDNSTNYFSIGQSVVIILAGSTPLKGTYNSLSLQVQMSKYPAPGATRTVPCSAAGALNYGVATAYYTGLSILTPGFSIDTFDFPNGAEINLNAFPASFNIPMPTTGANTSGSVWPPLGNVAPYVFSFSASGPKTSLNFNARGNTRPLTVNGSLSGNSTSFDEAHFKISHTIVE